MENAVRFRVTIGADRTVRLPDEIPIGEAEIIVLFPTTPVTDDDLARRTEARQKMFGRLRGQVTIAEDFHAPLPEELLKDFEGGDDP